MRATGLGLLVMAFLLSVCPGAAGQRRWDRWRHRWDATDLLGYFPHAELADPDAFAWSPTRELIEAPYAQGVIDWPEVVRVRVTADGLEFRRPPALPVLTAGLMQQAILVELSEGDAPTRAYPVARRFDLRDLRRLRLQHQPGTPTLYLLRVSDLPEGRSTFELSVELLEGQELGTLPLEFKTQPAAHLQVRVLDAATGQRTPARVGLYQGADDAGFQYPRQALTLAMIRDEDQWQFVRDSTWPGDNRRAFYTAGSFRVDVPPGPQRLVVKKGLEYTQVERRVDVAAGATEVIEVKLERVFDLPSEGWYSGDEHVHVERDGNNNEDLLEWTQGEDVHFAVILQMGDARRLYFPQYAWQQLGTARAGDHFLLSGQEDPRTLKRGHAIMIYNAVTHWNPERYLLYGDVFEATRADGGLAGYAHHGLSFHADRGMAVDVPLGRCDFVEALQNDVLDTTMLYHWWDLGFPLTPLGGSDYPYGRARSLGNSSFFVHLEGKPTVPAWVDSVRAGRVFVSSGPILDFDVDGVLPGRRLAPADRSQPATAHLRVRVNPTLDELAEVCLVSNGAVLESFTPSDEERHEMTRDVAVDVSSDAWFAVHVRGQRSVAHSNAVFVQDGPGPLCRGEALRQRLDRSAALLDELEGELDDGDVSASQAAALREVLESAREVYGKLRANARN